MMVGGWLYSLANHHEWNFMPRMRHSETIPILLATHLISVGAWACLFGSWLRRTTKIPVREELSTTMVVAQSGLWESLTLDRGRHRFGERTTILLPGLIAALVHSPVRPLLDGFEMMLPGIIYASLWTSLSVPAIRGMMLHYAACACRRNRPSGWAFPIFAAAFGLAFPWLLMHAAQGVQWLSFHSDPFQKALPHMVMVLLWGCGYWAERRFLRAYPYSG